ncbi:MAG: hypothetical protein R2822_30755 [Spirosomataceae bacterium]
MPSIGACRREERKVAVKEQVDALKEGRLESAFGAGTAVVVSPWSDWLRRHRLPTSPITPDSFTSRAKDFLNDIRTGKIEDPLVG